MIPYGRQSVSEEDIDAVVEALKSDFLTQGPRIQLFEQAVADYVSADHAVAVNSATSALHIACMALGLGRGDWLWTSPITFVASANCGLYCGANVDFVDIDSRTYNLCPKALEAKLIVAEREGRLPKVVVPVHLRGQSCDMAAIAELARRYGFRIIEDASHAIGGRYRGTQVGNCQFSDVVVFSFHPVKIVTSGEGGMALTNDPAIAKSMRLFSSHGVTRDVDDMTQASDGAWYYQQVALGFNYRMTDLQAALGHSQMKRIDEFVSRRHEIASRYDEMLAGLPVETPWQHPDTYSAFHLYVVRVDTDADRASRKQVFDRLRAQGVGVNVHYIPVHLQPFYQNLGFAAGDFPKAESYYDSAISLPIFPAMTEQQQNEVVLALQSALSE